MIYFIDGKPINNPELFTDDENGNEEMNWGEHILQFTEVDWENLSKYLQIRHHQRSRSNPFL